MRNLRIEFNSIIIKKSKSLGLASDHLGTILFILFALYEQRIDLLNEIDDDNKEKRIIILYRHLEKKGFLTRNVEEDRNYSLTEKAIVFIEFVKKEFYNEKHKEITASSLEPIVNEEIPEGKHLEWIEEYISIFPSDDYCKANRQRKLQTNPGEASERMKWFIKVYKHPKEVILEATRQYIKSQEESGDGHRFTRNSTFFIKKGTGSDMISDLASWCNNVINNKETNSFDTSIMDIG